MTVRMRLQEIGPYGIGWERRHQTWANEANLLFLDNPVGTGFSYVTDEANFSECPFARKNTSTAWATIAGLGFCSRQPLPWS